MLEVEEGEGSQPVRNAAQALRLVEGVGPDVMLSMKLKRGSSIVEISARTVGGAI